MKSCIIKLNSEIQNIYFYVNTINVYDSNIQTKKKKTSKRLKHILYIIQTI